MRKSSAGCTVLRAGKAGGFGGRYLVVSHKDGARAGGKGGRFIYLATHATPVGSLGDAVTGLKTVTGDKRQ